MASAIALCDISKITKLEYDVSITEGTKVATALIHELAANQEFVERCKAYAISNYNPDVHSDFHHAPTYKYETPEEHITKCNPDNYEIVLIALSMVVVGQIGAKHSLGLSSEFDYDRWFENNDFGDEPELDDNQIMHPHNLYLGLEFFDYLEDRCILGNYDHHTLFMTPDCHMYGCEGNVAEFDEADDCCHKRYAYTISAKDLLMFMLNDAPKIINGAHVYTWREVRDNPAIKEGGVEEMPVHWNRVDYWNRVN